MLSISVVLILVIICTLFTWRSISTRSLSDHNNYWMLVTCVWIHFMMTLSITLYPLIINKPHIVLDSVYLCIVFVHVCLFYISSKSCMINDFEARLMGESDSHDRYIRQLQSPVLENIIMIIMLFSNVAIFYVAYRNQQWQHPLFLGVVLAFVILRFNIFKEFYFFKW
jgi:hypothetical protein